MTALVGWLVEGSLLTVLATCAITLVPAALPAIRHRLWWLTLGIVLALPVFDIWLADIVANAVVSTAAPAVTSIAAPSSVPDSTPSLWLTLPEPADWLSTVLAAAWCLVACAGLVRLGRQVVAARRIVSAASPVSEQRVASWQAFSAARAHGRRAQVVSADIPGACAVGGRTPWIVIGRALLQQMEDREAETIVLHEYAHLLRYDDVTQLLQRVIVALVWCHPAVQWISRRIDAEREAASDRLASDHSGSAVTCARALARAAEISLGRPPLALRTAPGVSLSDNGLQGRVNRLLSDRTVRPWMASSVALIEAAVILTAGAAVFQTQPIVDFQASPQPASSNRRPLDDRPAPTEQMRSPYDGTPSEELLRYAEPQSNSAAELNADRHPRVPEDEPVSSGTASRPASSGGSERVSFARAGNFTEPAIQRFPPAAVGAMIAPSDHVAVRGAEQAEHPATLAPSVGSVASAHTSQPGESLVVHALNATGPTLPDTIHLEWSSLGASGDKRWVHASQVGAGVGRSAAAAGQAIGRFFQRQGRAVARRF